MPRPSLKEERREQILDAYEHCVARFGLEGATLEVTAKQAGLARALIRHNVGNRADLKEALIERFLTRSRSSLDDLIDALPRRNRLAVLVEWLFDPDYLDPGTVVLSEALIAASADDPPLARKMRGWTTDFVAAVENAIRQDYPDASEATVTAVAAGVTGIYFNIESLAPLGDMPGLLDASKQAALLLIATLEDR